MGEGKKYFNPFLECTFAPIPNWVLRQPSLSNGAKIAYGRLLQYAQKDGKAYPRQIVMAHELGRDERNVRSYISELVDKGLIEAERRGKKRSNLYSFIDHDWRRQGEVDRTIPPAQDDQQGEVALSQQGEVARSIVRHKKEEIKHKAQEASHLLYVEREDRAVPAEPPVMEMLTTSGKWALTPSMLANLQGAFPALDVKAQCHLAAIWLEDNPGRRKTAKGMPRFLSGWMGRARPIESPANNPSLSLPPYRTPEIDGPSDDEIVMMLSKPSPEQDEFDRRWRELTNKTTNAENN